MNDPQLDRTPAWRRSAATLAVALIAGIGLPVATVAVSARQETLIVLAVSSVLGLGLGALVYVHGTRRARAMEREHAGRLGELAALHEVSAELTGQLDLGQLAAALHRQARRLMDADHLVFVLWDEASRRLQIVYDPIEPDKVGRYYLAPRGLLARVIAGATAIRTDDFTGYCARLGIEPIAPGRYPYFLGVPMLVNGQTVGAIGLRSEHRPFTEADERLLLAIGRLAALAVGTVIAYDDAREQARQLAALVDVGRELAQARDERRVFDTIVRAAADVFGGEAGLRIVEGDELVRVGATPGALVAMPSERLRIGESISGTVAATGEPAIIEDALADPALIAAHRAQRSESIRALLCLPVTRGGRILGTLHVYRELGHRFDARSVAIATAFADHAAVAIEGSRLHARVVRDAEKVQSLLRGSQALIGQLDLDVVLGRLLTEAARIAGTPHVKVLLVDETRGTLGLAAVQGTAAPPEFEVPLGVGLSGIVAATGQPLLSEDARIDPRNVLADADRARGIVTYLGLPVRTGDEVLGVLSFNTVAPRAFTDDEIALLASFADLAALAVRSSRLYAAADRRIARLKTMTRLNQLVSSSLQVDEVLREINAAAATLMDAPIASFWLADEEQRTLEAIAFSDPERGQDFPAKRLAYGQGAVGWAAERRERVIIDDVHRDGRLVALDWWRREGLSSFVAIPVVLDGTLLAVIALNGVRPFTFDDEDDDLIETFVAQTAVAIRNARVYARSEGRRREAEALAEVGRVLCRTRDPEVVAGHVVEATRHLLHAEYVTLRRLDPAAGTLSLVAAVGPSPESFGGSVPVGTGVVGYAIARGQAVTTSNLFTDPRFPALTPEQRSRIERAGYASVLAVPLSVEGTVVGVLGVGDRAGREFGAEEIRIAQTFADQAALALESARLYVETRRAVTELSEKNAELDSFVYSVSHDLKAPLVAMEGMASLLLEDYGAVLDEDARHYLGRLQANVHQMERLIGDLLTLSRVGREARVTETVGLGELVAEFVAEQGDRLRARGVKVIVRNDVGLRGIRRQLEQVMGNLLGNAVKYMGAEPAPTIEVGAVAHAGAVEGVDVVECYVRDNGIGIDPAYHAKVFEIFQRLHEIEAEGTGVGLAIVRKIVEAAGGRIWIESEAGAGATFRFTWPVARDGAS